MSRSNRVESVTGKLCEVGMDMSLMSSVGRSLREGMLEG
jgi:hypothetical protein